MASRHDIGEAIMFLPLMAALAALAFGGFLAVLLLGWYSAHAWYWLFWQALGLWKPIALTLTTFATAITVYAVVVKLLPALFERAQTTWKRMKGRA